MGKVSSCYHHHYCKYNAVGIQIGKVCILMAVGAEGFMEGVMF